METDHALVTREKRAILKAKLGQAFRRQNAADAVDLMAAFDDLLVAEIAAARGGWREELWRDRTHEAAVQRAKAEAAKNRREAREIRGEDVRICTKCNRSDEEVEFYPDKKRRRPHCKPCELAAGAEYRDRKKAEQEAADRKAERRLHAVG